MTDTSPAAVFAARHVAQQKAMAQPVADLIGAAIASGRVTEAQVRAYQRHGERK